MVSANAVRLSQLPLGLTFSAQTAGRCRPLRSRPINHRSRVRAARVSGLASARGYYAPPWPAVRGTCRNARPLPLLVSPLHPSPLLTFLSSILLPGRPLPQPGQLRLGGLRLGQIVLRQVPRSLVSPHADAPSPTRLPRLTPPPPNPTPRRRRRRRRRHYRRDHRDHRVHLQVRALQKDEA